MLRLRPWRLRSVDDDEGCVMMHIPPSRRVLCREARMIRIGGAVDSRDLPGRAGGEGGRGC